MYRLANERTKGNPIVSTTVRRRLLLGRTDLRVGSHLPNHRKTTFTTSPAETQRTILSLHKIAQFFII